jgi:integration host factor subunit beta
MKPQEAPVKTVTKKELVNRIADRTGVTKVVAKEIIQSFLESIIDELAEGNRLEFREFGVFESRERAARRAQNPRTLEKVDVPAKRIVKFKVGRMMRKKVSGEDVSDIDLRDDDDDDDGPPNQPRRVLGGREATGLG